MTRDPRAALVAWRASTGYSQTEVGALFGVTGKCVGNWEQGRARVAQPVQTQLRIEGWLAHKRWTFWEPEHDTWLRDHAGEWPLFELATRLTAAYSVYRSPWAVESRVRRLGLSVWTRALLTRSQIAYYCGVDAQTVRHWVDRGWLRLPAWTPRSPQGNWAVPPAVLDAFIADYAVHLKVAQMPASRYRAQVAAQWARARWLSVDHIMAHLGVHRATVCRWITRGALPATRQLRQGAYAYQVRVRDFAAFLKQREAA